MEWWAKGIWRSWKKKRHRRIWWQPDEIWGKQRASTARAWLETRKSRASWERPARVNAPGKHQFRRVRRLSLGSAQNYDYVPWFLSTESREVKDYYALISAKEEVNKGTQTRYIYWWGVHLDVRYHMSILRSVKQIDITFKAVGYRRSSASTEATRSRPWAFATAFARHRFRFVLFIERSGFA